MKKWLRKCGFLRRAYVGAREKLIRRLSPVAPVLVSRIRYWQCSGRRLNLKDPQEFNEKVMWLKLNTYYKNPLIIQCADKVRVRRYVEKCGCKEILIDCLGVYENTKQIPWDTLPQQFVLKCNHGAGYNIICPDKDMLDKKETIRQLDRWLKEDYSLDYAEMQYHYIRPKIICEKYLQPAEGVLPDDYKVYCFHGRAECIMHCHGRGEQITFCFYDRDWNLLKWNKSAPKDGKGTAERPSCLEDLLMYAEKLSAGIPFVRMDFYVLDDRVYFGEMTFTPSGCMAMGYTKEGNRELSRRIHLPMEKAEGRA